MIEMQKQDGPQSGCLRWYWEETGIEDTNAALRGRSAGLPASPP
jgi:hypothetical protein